MQLSSGVDDGRRQKIGKGPCLPGSRIAISFPEYRNDADSFKEGNRVLPAEAVKHFLHGLGRITVIIFIRHGAVCEIAAPIPCLGKLLSAPVILFEDADR